MSVREKIRSLTFHDDDSYWDGRFGEELTGWSARFRLELHGDQTPYGGGITHTCYDSDSTLEWDAAPGAPPGDERLLGNLERFVIAAFHSCVGIRFVIEPVNLDEVEYDSLEEDEEEATT